MQHVLDMEKAELNPTPSPGGWSSRDKPVVIVTTNDIIAQAARAAEEAQRTREEEALIEKERAEKEAERLAKKAAEKAAMTPEEKERRKDRQILKLVGAVVVKVLSKYQDQFSREDFKKHAQEVRFMLILRFIFSDTESILSR